MACDLSDAKAVTEKMWT